MQYQPVSTFKNFQNSKKAEINNKDHIKNYNKINKIKNQIQSVLSRHNSPLPYISIATNKKVFLQTYQTVEQKNNDHMSRIKRKNRKQYKEKQSTKTKYEQFLFSGFINGTKKPHKSKQSQTVQNSTEQTINKNDMKQTYTFLIDKNLSKELKSSRQNFYSGEKSQRNLFSEKEHHKLGIGKIYFHKNYPPIKLRREDLLNNTLNSTLTQRENIFKYSMNTTITPRDESLDISKYMTLIQSPNLSSSRSSFKDKQKQLQVEQKQLTSKKSLQIFKKTILPKTSLNQSKPPLIFNNQQFKVIGSLKKYRTSNQRLQHQAKIRQKHFSPIPPTPDQLLNVVDEQLLIYYAKLRQKDPLKKIRSFSKQTNYQRQNDLKQSYETKSRRDKRDRFDLDPWDKIRLDDEHFMTSLHSMEQN